MASILVQHKKMTYVITQANRKRKLERDQEEEKEHAIISLQRITE